MPSISFRTQLVPYQLAGVISPWNGPLMLSCLDPVPALFAGSAVIVKPSEVAPRFVEPLMQTIRAVPELAGVFTFVTGDGETGQQLIKLIDLLCFTGSVPNGRKVAVACAQRLIPAYLELGGKDPAIVTETADLDAAATAVLRGARSAPARCASRWSGSTCTSQCTTSSSPSWSEKAERSGSTTRTSRR